MRQASSYRRPGRNTPRWQKVVKFTKIAREIAFKPRRVASAGERKKRNGEHLAHFRPGSKADNVVRRHKPGCRVRV